MKKLVISFLCGMMLCTVGCGPKNSSELQVENDSLRNEIAKMQVQYDETFTILNAIQQSFEEIKISENYLTMQAGNTEITPSVEEQIQNNVKTVQDILMKNKQQLTKLRSQLSSSQKKTKGLMENISNLEKSINEKTEMITKLQSDLAEKNIRIAELDQAVNNLKQSVNEVSSENASHKAKIQEQEKALNQAWYVFGSKEELKKIGLISKGSIFKKEEVMKGEINNDNFIGVDIRTLDKVELFSKKAKMLTTHPSNSYSLEKTDDGYMVLYIKNTEKFWSASRYLVVQVD